MVKLTGDDRKELKVIGSGQKLMTKLKNRHRHLYNMQTMTQPNYGDTH